jgi:protein-L-isoaspartate(D-aspartate) O-methyltransferase
MVDGLEHPTNGAVQTGEVAAAMRTVPRVPFVPDRARAYTDRPDEAHGTRVLAPGTAARLIEALEVEPDGETLIVGAGVGYTAALIAELSDPGRVQAIDIARPVVHAARRNLAEAGFDAVLVDRRDAATGLPEYGPFDRILVEGAAAGPPDALAEQLAPAGRLVLPVGGSPPTLAAFEAGADSAGDEPRLRRVEAFGPIELEPLLAPGEESGAVPRDRSAREAAELASRDARARTGWEQDWIDWDW